MNLSGEFAKTLLDLAPDPTVVVDPTGTIVFANAEVEQAFGYSPAELTGARIEMLLPERFRAGHTEHRATFAGRPQARPMGAGLALFGLHKSGREFPVEISLSPVRSDVGTLVVAAVRDATVHRDAERQLREANRAKSRLLAAASHDLRQPLQTLNLLNRAATRYAAGNDVLVDLLGRQQAALDTMSALLATALDISKLDGGAITPDIGTHALAIVFEHLRSDFEPLAEDKGLTLVVEPTTEGVRTDAELLRRLLGNLLSNSIRYTTTGTVRLACRRADNNVEVVLSDTGIGIAPEHIERIFEEFYQVDHSTQRPEGLGLGLSIVRRLASLIGATVRVESQLGRGTSFTIVVPRAEVAAPHAAVAPASPSTNGGRVLVVDDEPAVATATSLLLELEGFDVRVASCERDALELALVTKPDIIISDYQLRGGETGIGVVAAVRNRLGATIPVVFVTGDTRQAAFSRAKIERSTLLAKPIRADELLNAIRSQINAEH